MIPLHDVTILNTPVNVLSFAATADITELGFTPGTLHLRHTHEDDPSWTVPFETTTQHATLWVIAAFNGVWMAAGVERIRPGQQDKPEGDNPTDFLLHWVEGRPFDAFNGHVFRPGDPIGVFVVAGNSRLAGAFSARERSHVVEVQIPPASGQSWRAPFLWAEGQAAAPPPPVPPAPPVPPEPPPTGGQGTTAPLSIVPTVFLTELETKLTDILHATERTDASLKWLAEQIGAVSKVMPVALDAVVVKLSKSIAKVLKLVTPKKPVVKRP
jgi:hypothetical protein